MHRMHFHAFGRCRSLRTPASGVQKPANLLGDVPALSAICQPHGVLPQVALVQQSRRVRVQAVDRLPDDIVLQDHLVALATWHWHGGRCTLAGCEVSTAALQQTLGSTEMQFMHGSAVQPQQHAENARKCTRCMEVRIKQDHSWRGPAVGYVLARHLKTKVRTTTVSRAPLGVALGEKEVRHACRSCCR